ncbi:hypothetical protein PybrP1_006360 [[Pythium] brassicae (nom. inval.)]|nr:hypothetical protein PybrP1_006360 [[Pythium] brassicae (nom. inval.)]
MVLPVILTGAVVAGCASGYGMYRVGVALALPAHMRSTPPPTSALGVVTGSAIAGGAYSLQRRILHSRFAHLTRYEVPADVAHWGFRDFLRVTGPFLVSRVAMASTSVAVLGFASTAVDAARASSK